MHIEKILGLVVCLVFTSAAAAQTVELKSTVGLDQVYVDPYATADGCPPMLDGTETFAATVAPWEHSAWSFLNKAASNPIEGIYDLVGAQFISSSYYVGGEGTENNPTVGGDSWRWFKRTIELECASADGYNGFLNVCADNAEAVYVNGTQVPSPDPVRTGEVCGPDADNQEWRQPATYDIGPYLQDGSNEILFLVRNYQGSNSVTANPTMLLYKGQITYSAAPEGPAVSAPEGIQCQTLYAGQTIDAGNVCVEVIGDDLVVSYSTTDGWELTETHLWVGENESDMPQTRKGNPIPGQFPYASGDITGATFWSVAIPLSELGFSCPGADTTYWVAAHAALRKLNSDGTYQTETGWGDGDPTGGRNWSTFFGVTLTCITECDSGGPAADCETAYAYGGDAATCFIGMPELEECDTPGPARWGWTNMVEPGGSYTWPIYAGAGQCELSKGLEVGVLLVDYLADGSVTVEYMVFEGYVMAEVHLYVGYERLARVDGVGCYTVANGQLPMIAEETGDGWYWAGVQGSFDGVSDLYVVAHAKVCAEEN